MTFSIRSVFAIIAIYSVLFVLMRPLGTPGIICDAFSGTAFSGVIILVRRSNLVAVVSVAVGALMGAFVALCSNLPAGLLLRTKFHTYVAEVERTDIINAVLGAIIGAFVAMLVIRTDSPRRDSSK